MSTLEELLYGNFDLCDRQVKKDSEYHQMTNDILSFEERLFQSLNQEERFLYEEIIGLRNLQESIIEKEFFIDGFRIGARVMLEILTEQERLFENA